MVNTPSAAVQTVFEDLNLGVYGSSAAGYKGFAQSYVAGANYGAFELFWRAIPPKKSADNA